MIDEPKRQELTERIEHYVSGYVWVYADGAVTLDGDVAVVNVAGLARALEAVAAEVVSSGR